VSDAKNFDVIIVCLAAAHGYSEASKLSKKEDKHIVTIDPQAAALIVEKESPGKSRGRKSMSFSRRQTKSLTSVSAICTALSAAPLRRLSETHQSERPLSTVESSRTRLT